MPSNGQIIKYKYGLKAKYDEMTEHDLNTIYFCTDTMQIFIGDDEYTKVTEKLSSTPVSGSAGKGTIGEHGKLYFCASDSSLYLCNVSGGTTPTFTWTKVSNNYTYNHPVSGITAGSYKSVTVDKNGHVTKGTNPTTLGGYGITDGFIVKNLINEDLNNIKTPGHYYGSGGNKVTNKPTEVSFDFFNLLVYKQAGGYIKQEINNLRYSYYRTYTNSWSNWIPIPRFNIAPTSNKLILSDANGVLHSSTYTLSKSVPSDAVFTDTTYEEATTETSGLLSSSDKAKLNKINENHSNVLAGADLGHVKTGGDITFNNGIGKVTSVNASVINGKINIDNLPAAALERLKLVTNDTARLALTIADVQNGDTVKVTSTGKMYFVKDDTKLGTENAFEAYTASAASAVAWSGITDKPSVTYTLDGDVTGNIKSTIGSTVSISTTLKDSGVKAGTYKSVTVDSKGRVTSGTNPTTLAGYGIKNSYTKDEINNLFKKKNLIHLVDGTIENNGVVITTKNNHVTIKGTAIETATTPLLLEEDSIKVLNQNENYVASLQNIVKNAINKSLTTYIWGKFASGSTTDNPLYETIVIASTGSYSTGYKKINTNKDRIVSIKINVQKGATYDVEFDIMIESGTSMSAYQSPVKYEGSLPLGSVLKTSLSQEVVDMINNKSLNDLSDVTIDSLADKQILIYDANTSLFKNISLNKGLIGLDKVDNTADSEKSVLSASKLKTGRKITFIDAITGSGSFDGSSDISIKTTLSNISTNKITALTGYTVPTTYSELRATDSLNTALGKLQKGVTEAKQASNNANIIWGTF